MLADKANYVAVSLRLDHIWHLLFGRQVGVAIHVRAAEAVHIAVLVVVLGRAVGVAAVENAICTSSTV